MSKEKSRKTTVTVRLTEEEYSILRRLCDLKKTTQTAYLARLATSQAKQELLSYAVEEYRQGRASLSELAKRIGKGRLSKRLCNKPALWECCGLGGGSLLFCRRLQDFAK